MLILSPARTVIELCGGDLAVSKMVGRGVIRVRRWSWPREKGGSDGIIPVDVMLTLLSSAPANGIRGLTADHFTKDANLLSRDDLRVLALLMDGHTTEEIAATTKAAAAEVEAAEQRLRKSPAVSPQVWERVNRRRSRRMVGECLP